MKNKLLLFIMILAFSILIIGCEELEMNDNKNSSFVSEKAILKMADLSYDDIPYLNLERYIEENLLTEEVIGLFTEKELKDMILQKNEEEKQWQQHIQTSSYNLFSCETISMPTNFDYRTCSRIVAYHLYENNELALVLDSTNQMVYYGYGVLSSTNNAEKSVALSESTCNQVINLIEKAHLDTLEYEYSSEEETYSRNSWAIAFECDSGVVRYYVFNTNGNGADSIIDLVNELLDYGKKM